MSFRSLFVSTLMNDLCTLSFGAEGSASIISGRNGTITFASTSTTLERAHEDMNPTLGSVLEERVTSCDNNTESLTADWAIIVISSTLLTLPIILANSSPAWAVSCCISCPVSCSGSQLCPAAYCPATGMSAAVISSVSSSAGFIHR